MSSAPSVYGPGGGTGPPDISAHGGVQSGVIGAVVLVDVVLGAAPVVDGANVVGVVVGATVVDVVVAGDAVVPPHAASRATTTRNERLRSATAFMALRLCAWVRRRPSGTRR